MPPPRAVAPVVLCSLFRNGNELPTVQTRDRFRRAVLITRRAYKVRIGTGDFIPSSCRHDHSICPSRQRSSKVLMLASSASQVDNLSTSSDRGIPGKGSSTSLRSNLGLTRQQATLRLPVSSGFRVRKRTDRYGAATMWTSDASRTDSVTALILKLV